MASIMQGMDRVWLSEIAERTGTPVYVYSLSRIRKRIEEIRDAISSEGFRLYFATMANDEPAVLSTISRGGVGACVNSSRHLQLALSCGFSPPEIQFTSSGIPKELMCELVDAGITCNLDSESQLEQWFSSGGTEAGLRLNCGALAGLAEAESDRLGMDEGTARRIVRSSSSHGRQISGLHMYAGTNFLDAMELVRRLEYLFEFAAEVPTLNYLNIGGGIGIDYTGEQGQFDLKCFGQCIDRMARQLRKRLSREIIVIFEPGRGLIADAGVFITRITDIKCLRGQNYVAVDGSVAVFPRPLHHPKECHRVIPLRESEASAQQTPCTIVGKTTFSKDILARTVLSTAVRVGDLLAFCDAGAYSRSMASRFLGQDEPKAFIFD